MGPRLFSRGKESTPFTALWIARASMGPRLFSRGKGTSWRRCAVHLEASMGPRLFSRGKQGLRACLWTNVPMLQWGHGCLAVESEKMQKKTAKKVALQWGHGCLAVESFPSRSRWVQIDL